MPSCREIVSIQIGQCGNQIGNKFWEMSCGEHDIGGDGKPTWDDVAAYEESVLDDKLGVFMEKSVGGKYVPRACLVDLEPGTLDQVKNGKLGELFKPDNYTAGASGAGNNWAKGHYTEGAELIDEVLDNVRKETENTNSLQGFQICQSLGGGTGSGMGTLLLLKLRDTYPDRLTTTYSVYPSPKISDTVVEPYNGVLASHQLIENADQTYVIDNESLFRISCDLLKDSKPNYADLNVLIGKVMLGVTSSLRFPGQMNGDIRKLGVNLVPFPRLHFFAIAQAPLYSAKNAGFVKLKIQELTTQVWSGANFFSSMNTDEGKYLTAQCTYRGDMASQEVDEQVARMQDAKADNFVEWIPNNIKSSIVNIPPKDSALSATFVANTTAMKDMFARLSTQFDSLYKRKAMLHWYKGEGMDEMEFQEAFKNVQDLITEYQDKQDATVGGDEDAADDEE